MSLTVLSSLGLFMMLCSFLLYPFIMRFYAGLLRVGDLRLWSAVKTFPAVVLMSLISRIIPFLGLVVGFVLAVAMVGGIYKIGWGKSAGLFTLTYVTFILTVVVSFLIFMYGGV